jgi:hypothetical protein
MTWSKGRREAGTERCVRGLPVLLIRPCLTHGSPILPPDVQHSLLLLLPPTPVPPPPAPCDLCHCPQAIVSGLQQSVRDFKGSIKGVSSHDVLELMLITQYFDMLREVRARESGRQGGVGVCPVVVSGCWGGGGEEGCCAWTPWVRDPCVNAGRCKCREV